MEPYSEQVVLLDGQGIWYRSISLPTSLNVTRSSYGLPQAAVDGHIYLCAQSLFKMQPSFDHVIGAILERDPQVESSGSNQYN